MKSLFERKVFNFFLKKQIKKLNKVDKLEKLDSSKIKKYLNDEGLINYDSMKIESLAKWPFKSLHDLRVMVGFGEYEIISIAKSSNKDFFDAVCSRPLSILKKILFLSVFLVPIFAIYLAFKISFLFLLMILFVPVFIICHEKIYQYVICSNSLSCEAGFCFLYMTKEIAINDPKSGLGWFYDN